MRNTLIASLTTLVVSSFALTAAYADRGSSPQPLADQDFLSNNDFRDRDRRVDFNMTYAFGGDKKELNRMNYIMSYDRRSIGGPVWRPPLMQAHYAAGEWQSLSFTGLNILNQNFKLNQGEGSWTPWITGALVVGATAVAINSSDDGSDDLDNNNTATQGVNGGDSDGGDPVSDAADQVADAVDQAVDAIAGFNSYYDRFGEPQLKGGYGYGSEGGE